MTWIALRMLMGDRAKYLGLIFGVSFATLLMTQQVSIFMGIMTRTANQILDDRLLARSGHERQSSSFRAENPGGLNMFRCRTWLGRGLAFHSSGIASVPVWPLHRPSRQSRQKF